MALNDEGNGASCLFGVDLFQLLETFYLDGVTKGVEEEHSGLLSRFAGKADLWFEHELHCPAGVQTIGQLLPIPHLQDHAQMRHGHHVLTNLASVGHGKRLA